MYKSIKEQQSKHYIDIQPRRYHSYRQYSLRCIAQNIIIDHFKVAKDIVPLFIHINTAETVRKQTLINVYDIIQSNINNLKCFMARVKASHQYSRGILGNIENR